MADQDTAAATSAIKPDSAAPAWAPDIKPEMQAVIEQLASYKDTPIPKLTAQQARKNHTPTDAVMDFAAANNVPTPPSLVDTMGKDIPVKGGNVKVDSKNYDGVTHEFFGMALIVPQAKDAQAYGSDALKKAFKK